MNNRSQRRKFVVAGLVALPLLAIAFLLRFPGGPRPMCHKILDSAFQEWALETKHTNDYPNAKGNGSASLAMIEPYAGHDIQQYGYVPGLRFDDREDLVLMYMKKKTRYTWHGDTDHSLLTPRRWMVLSPHIIIGTGAEGGTLMDTPAFKRTLQRTIAYLKEKDRPDWKTVMEEQMKFLASIGD